MNFAILIVQLPASLVLAIAGDWAIHVHAQNMWATGHQGLSDTKYRLGPPLRLLLMLLYLAPLNYLFFMQDGDNELGGGLFLLAMAVYGIYAGVNSVSEMKPLPDADSERGDR